MPKPAAKRISPSWIQATLRELYARRLITRSELVAATGLDPASVSNALAGMFRDGLVRKQGDEATGGRRRDCLCLVPDAGYFIAIDLEGTCTRLALTDFSGAIRYRWEEPVFCGRPLEIASLLRGIDETLRPLSAAERKRVLSVGIAYMGAMGRDGRITSYNFGWEEFPFCEAIRSACPYPVFLEDSCLAKLLVETWLGTARGCRDCVYLTVSHGVGLAAVIGGKPLTGTDGIAGELGHITIDPSASCQCACGKRGCLETVTSSASLVRYYCEQTGRAPDSMRGDSVVEIFARARNGEPAACAVMDRASYYLGLGLSYVVHILGPQLIILGGDLIHAGDLLIPRLRAELSRHVLPKMLAKLDLRISSLGYDIGVIAAASLAFHGALSDPALLSRICRTALGPGRASGRRRLAATAVQ